MSRWSRTKRTIDLHKISMFDQKQDVATRIKAQQGIEKSFANADTEWKRVAQEAVVYCAKNYREFTTDMVMEYLAKLGIHTGEPRALGAIIQGASRSGMIQKSGRYKESYRRHNAPIPVWISNIKGE